jgi:hypothetical protein
MAGSLLMGWISRRRCARADAGDEALRVDDTSRNADAG